MADNSFNSTLESLFKGMDAFITTKTVVGDAVRFEDGTIILPLVDVSFGVAAGAFTNVFTDEGSNGGKNNGNKSNGGGGMGGKIQPSAVLVIKDGVSKLVNVKNQDSVTKILDMVPDFVDRFSKKDGKDEEKNENI